jgi:hypothetical protein
MASESDLILLMAECSKDPYKFVMAAFPWGEKGSELQDQTGPRTWQKEVLLQIGERLKAGASPEDAIKIAVASGHGIGKSALVAWLVLWAMSTRENTRGVVTANTKDQLTTKTWPEVSKWFRMLICESWFTMTATTITAKDQRYEKTWRIDAVTWSLENLEAFAGLHNEGSRLMLIMDEASNIADPVWEVAEGAMTDENTEIMWIVFGNPTRTDGRFRECFRKYQHRWWTRNVDSRTVEGTNKRQIQQWVDDFGEDSDFLKVRVRGIFPDKGEDQFISSDLAIAACAKPGGDYLPHEPFIMGVDVARYGKDWSVVWMRRGADAKTWPRRRFRELSLMELADSVASIIDFYKPDCVCIDETGVGGGVVDRLRQLGHPITAVNFSSKPPSLVDGMAVANMRAYLWARGREWLRRGGSIPDEEDLRSQLISTGYGYNIRNEILLTPKDDLDVSPDDIDALWTTFAIDPGPRQGFGFHEPPTHAIDNWSLDA